MKVPVGLTIALAALAAVGGALAQQEKTRPATEADFIGYWRVLLIPDEVHRSRLKNAALGRGGPCRFLIHRSSGARYDVSIDNMAGPEESERRCPAHRGGVDVSLTTIARGPARYLWSKATPQQDGFFFVSDTAVTDPKVASGSLWKADYVLVDIPATPAFAFDLRKGDLLMQITERLPDGDVKPVWPMLLRPVPD